MTSENPPPGFENFPPPENQPPGYQNYPPQQNQPPGYQNYPPQQHPTENLPPGYQPYPPAQGTPTETLPPGYQPFPPPQQPARKSHGKLIASVAAVVVLAGGGTATYLALSSSSNSGAGSPTEAVQRTVGDLQQSDLLGLLDDLAPGERSALSGAVRSDIDSLKRLGVLAKDANGSAISGISIKASGITYGNPVTINDHVQVVPITSGSLDVSADASKLPLTQEILSLMGGAPRVSQHVQIPPGVRIAAEKVGGGWYTSLFYTVADSAAHHRIPSPADAIPATGARSPQDAVVSFVQAAIRHDYRTMIGLVSPDELGALHDYGGMIAGKVPLVPGVGTNGITLKSLELNTEDISGGVRLTPRKIVLSQNGRDLAVTLQGDCFTFTQGAHSQKLCAADLIQRIIGSFTHQVCIGVGQRSCTSQGADVTPQQQTALTHVVHGLLSLGVDATESGGRWYIAPIRTYADLTSTLLGALQGNDLFALASLAR